MVPEFDEVVFALKPGEISAVFRSPFGFHIAKVLERRAPGLQPLSEVREDIEQAIWRDTKRRLVGDLMEGLRAKADIRKA
jgi:parvulin-like peptidyl-prolyl isomerase